MLSIKVRDTGSFKSTPTSPRAYKLRTVQNPIVSVWHGSVIERSESLKRERKKITARDYFVLRVFDSKDEERRAFMIYVSD